MSNTLWTRISDNAEKIGGEAITVLNGVIQKGQNRAIVIWKKPNKVEYGFPDGWEYCTSVCIWDDDNLFFEHGHYMMKDYNEAYEDAKGR